MFKCRIILTQYGFLFSETVHVPVWVVPGTITFPRQQGSHVIMVGPGTGCAPFRTYIEERVGENVQGIWKKAYLLICTSTYFPSGSEIRGKSERYQGINSLL